MLAGPAPDDAGAKSPLNRLAPALDATTSVFAHVISHSSLSHFHFEAACLCAFLYSPPGPGVGQQQRIAVLLFGTPVATSFATRWGPMAPARRAAHKLESTLHVRDYHCSNSAAA